MKKYESLYKRYRDQPAENIFSSFFSSFSKHEDNRWEKPYREIVASAREENWNFTREEFQQEDNNYPILKNYLNYTFKRVQEQGSIIYTKEEDKACFNTGLQTKDDKDIFLSFYRNKRSKEYDKPDWTFHDHFDSYSPKLTIFPQVPELATYIDDANDLIFDTKVKLDVNYEHIIDDNNERLPVELRSNRTLALNSIKGAVESLKNRIIRNYKVPIPNWYQDKIQLLLPLYLTGEQKADLALAVVKDKEGNIYRVKTAFKMDQAYMNARLITRPDRDWLNP